MDTAPHSRQREVTTGLAILIIIVVIVGAVALGNKKKTADAQAPATSTAASTPAVGSTTQSAATTSTAAASTSIYKDGSYTSTASYDTPGGEEEITLQVTLANDVVTATSATFNVNDREGQEYASEFTSAYKSLVVGKDIGSLSLSRVSGASLTTEGFNTAIQQIEATAQA